nr:hypothetical protein GCM10020092_049640 [Actinoplanes digitatis]
MAWVSVWSSESDGSSCGPGRGSECVISAPPPRVPRLERRLALLGRLPPHLHGLAAAELERRADGLRRLADQTGDLGRGQPLRGQLERLPPGGRQLGEHTGEPLRQLVGDQVGVGLRLAELGDVGDQHLGVRLPGTAALLEPVRPGRGAHPGDRVGQLGPAAQRLTDGLGDGVLRLPAVGALAQQAAHEALPVTPEELLDLRGGRRIRDDRRGRGGRDRLVHVARFDHRCLRSPLNSHLS